MFPQPQKFFFILIKGQKGSTFEMHSVFVQTTTPWLWEGAFGIGLTKPWGRRVIYLTCK